MTTLMAISTWVLVCLMALDAVMKFGYLCLHQYPRISEKKPWHDLVDGFIDLVFAALVVQLLLNSH